MWPVHKPHIILIDGESGVGKSTLANRMAAALGATVVNLDDAYPGWGGLFMGAAEITDGVLKPISEGKPGRFTKWDWSKNCSGETVMVEVPALLIVEGCGASTPDSRKMADTVIWVSAEETERKERRSAREGGANETELRKWDKDVSIHIERNHPIETASVRIRT